MPLITVTVTVTGHGIFILATHPEDLQDMNNQSQPSFTVAPSIPVQTQQRALVSKARSPPTDSKTPFDPAPLQTQLDRY